MPFADCDGIRTRYELTGSGPALLMWSPGGFDSKLENWARLALYRRVNLVARLSERYTCITFDRRESGRSGGRLEPITWSDYAAQGRALLDHLGIDRAHLMGGCVGCSSALALAVDSPSRAASVVLFSPAGGPRYRLTQQARFGAHLDFARADGLTGVVALAAASEAGFSTDPRVGPWASVLRTDPDFATDYAATDLADYEQIVTATVDGLFDRDTVPGPQPRELMALEVPAIIVPGQDTSHAPSAARYLQECLPNVEYWDVPVDEQTEQNAPAALLGFLDAVS